MRMRPSTALSTRWTLLTILRWMELQPHEIRELEVGEDIDRIIATVNAPAAAAQFLSSACWCIRHRRLCCRLVGRRYFERFARLPAGTRLIVLSSRPNPSRQTQTRARLRLS